MQTITHTSKVGRKELLRALDHSLAMVEFALDGTILSANANYLSMCGYQLQELVGNNHKLLCAGGHLLSRAYTDCWEKIRPPASPSAPFPRPRTARPAFRPQPPPVFHARRGACGSPWPPSSLRAAR